MDRIYEIVEKYFDVFIKYVVLLIELIGTIILVYAVVSAIIGLFKHQKHVRLKLAEGIALALEFKIGGELLRTVIVRNWEELLILGAIILLRAALTFLIQWEIKIERKSGNLTDLQVNDIQTPLTQDMPKDNSANQKRKTKQNSNQNTDDSSGQ